MKIGKRYDFSPGKKSYVWGDTEAVLQGGGYAEKQDWEESYTLWDVMMGV